VFLSLPLLLLLRQFAALLKASQASVCLLNGKDKRIPMVSPYLVHSGPIKEHLVSYHSRDTRTMHRSPARGAVPSLHEEP